MKKIFLTGLVLLVSLHAMGEAPTPAKDNTPESSGAVQEIIIDNFDDADITTAPNWWVFDRVQSTFPEAADKKYGLYYLKVTGKADSYYVGGIGTYIAKDASNFDTLVVDVYGNGPGTGTIKVNVFDDDNGNYQIEQDSKYEPLYDDRLEYEIPVTWTGWQTVEIPLNKLVDTNPGLGDDVVNLDQKNGSGGLVQVQFVFLTLTPTANINMCLDNIRLMKK